MNKSPVFIPFNKAIKESIAEGEGFQSQFSKAALAKGATKHGISGSGDAPPGPGSPWRRCGAFSKPQSSLPTMMKPVRNGIPPVFVTEEVHPFTEAVIDVAMQARVKAFNDIAAVLGLHSPDDLLLVVDEWKERGGPSISFDELLVQIDEIKWDDYERKPTGMKP
jgi:hypothetical protein